MNTFLYVGQLTNRMSCTCITWKKKASFAWQKWCVIHSNIYIQTFRNKQKEYKMP